MTSSNTGTVTNIKVWQDGSIDHALVTLIDSTTNLSELFVLWGSEVGQPTAFSVWIARSLVVSMLKSALENRLLVTITHGDTSALVLAVELLAA